MCCRIRTVAKLSAMSTQAISSWRCDDCSHETGSTHSRSDTEDTSLLYLPKSIKKEMADTRKSNKASFSTLEKAMSSLQVSMDEMKSKLATVEKENASLKSECIFLRKENESLTKRVCDLQFEVLDVQQYSRANNLEIRGIPITKNENIYAVLESVAAAIGVPYDRANLSIAHRLPTPRDRRFQPNIVVQFVSRTTRSEWLAAAKSKRIQTTDLAPSLPPAPVFIHDHLTIHNKSVLGRAKSLVKLNKLAYAWSKDGKILVRKSADSPVLRVRTINDVEAAAATGRGNAVAGGGGAGSNN